MLPTPWSLWGPAVLNTVCSRLPQARPYPSTEGHMSWAPSKQELPAHPPFISACRVLSPGSLWVMASRVPQLKIPSSLRTSHLALAEESNGRVMSQAGTGEDLFGCASQWLVNMQRIYPKCRTGAEEMSTASSEPRPRKAPGLWV